LFLAEKGITVECGEINLRHGEQLTADFQRRDHRGVGVGARAAGG